MEIFVTLLALGFLQVWGSRNPFHQDGWYHSWLAYCDKFTPLSSEFKVLISILLPLVVVSVVLTLVAWQSVWWGLPLAVIILLYSFGRGEFFEIVREYTQACYVEDWQSATERAGRFNVDTSLLADNDWSSLHGRVFDEAGYRGFERMFAVLFWFLVLGPIGGLMYRLVFIHAATRSESVFVQRWLWLLEWPAVRLLGFTFALTGNFSGCVDQLRAAVFSIERSTVSVLSPMILGALSVNDHAGANCEITRKELSLMSKLYQRSLWFWMGGASLMVIMS